MTHLSEDSDLIGEGGVGAKGALPSDRAAPATQRSPAVSGKASIPSAVSAAMMSYLEAARLDSRWSRFEFRLCPELFRAISLSGERPAELFGARVREVDTWAWGWQLWVGNSIRAPFPFEPAQAIEARRAETQSGSVADESAAPKGCAQ